MRLLLDTHIALWAVADPDRLAAGVRDWIADPDNAVAVSIAALWEIAIKRSVRRGQPNAPTLSAKDARLAFAEADFDLLAIESGHCDIVEDLPFHHRDPFDRLLVATALAGRYSLLTHDSTLAAYGDCVMVV